MMDFEIKRTKRLKIFAIMAVLAVVAVIAGFTIHNLIYSATVNIIVAPTIAEVKIGGVSFGKGPSGEHKIRPGEYEVVVSADGFITKTTNIIVTNEETAQVKLYLEPAAGNENWYEQHPEDALFAGEISSYWTYLATEKLVAKNPILEKLPYSTEYFTDDYSKRVKYTIWYEFNEDLTEVSYVVSDYSGGSRELALAWMQEQGVSEKNSKIRYQDLSIDNKWGRAED